MNPGAKNLVEETFEWTIADYERAFVQDVNRDGKLVSPIFGPPEQAWQMRLFTKPIEGRYTAHVGWALEVVKSPLEKQAQDWTRNIIQFGVEVRRKKGEPVRYFPLDRREYSEEKRSWGFPQLLERDNFHQKYVLDDGCLVLKCKIKYERLPHIRFACSPPIDHPLLFSEELSDIKIMTADGILIPAHKVALYSCPYFKAHTSFTGIQGKDAGKVQSIFPSPAIRSMLELLYTGQISAHAPQSFGERCDLIRLADMYQLPHLHARVAELMIANDLTDKNARQLLSFAHKHGQSPACDVLRDVCVGVVRRNLKLYVLEREYVKWVRGMDQDLAEIVFGNEGAKPGVEEMLDFGDD
ncbi:hypothetical protein HK104_011031 [Borealophlyctis nickersoniae]|nr:hypothetical protein HK104_011031 [Borealophlyctis nickersoniae]